MLLYVAGCAGWAARRELDAPVCIIALMPGSMPHLIDIQMNGRILAATFAIACGAGLIVGLFPALQAIVPAAGRGSARVGRHDEGAATWTRTSLVVAQIALSLVLLVGAVAAGPHVPDAAARQSGIHDERQAHGVDQAAGPARVHAPRRSSTRCFERMRGIPGVQGVAGSTYLPVSGSVGHRDDSRR